MRDKHYIGQCSDIGLSEKLKTEFFNRNRYGVVDIPLGLYPGVPGLIPGIFSLPDETLSCGPIPI